MAIETERPATKLLTIEEYVAQASDGPPDELVRGRVVRYAYPYLRHGLACSEIAFSLGRASRAQADGGEILIGPAGIITGRDPDSVRGADVAYYSKDKPFPRGEEAANCYYLPFPPDLIAEVRSHDEDWTNLLTKTAEYLAIGVRVVIVLDSDDESATVFTPEAGPVRLGSDDELTVPDLLPEFRVRVGAIFE